jgi:hypothetical protein
VDATELQEIREDCFEARCRFEVAAWFQVSADVQHRIEPGIAEDRDDTVVLG